MSSTENTFVLATLGTLLVSLKLEINVYLNKITEFVFLLDLIYYNWTIRQAKDYYWTPHIDIILNQDIIVCVSCPYLIR